MKISGIIRVFMKLMKTIWGLQTSLLMIMIFSLLHDSRAQTKSKSIKDYCTILDGRMIQTTSEKMVPLNVMKNSIKCNDTGECVLLNGIKMIMKKGECIDTDGNMVKPHKELPVQAKLNPRKKRPRRPVPSIPFMRLRVTSLGEKHGFGYEKLLI